MFSPDFNTPLAQVVDDCILSAPTDCRRQLYNNIVLSGGSTMFKVHFSLVVVVVAVRCVTRSLNYLLRPQAFGKRLERDIKKRVTARYNRNLELFNITKEEDKPKKLEVEVESSSTQKYAAWFGGSCLGAEPGFKAACHSRADYMEHGARIVRNTQGFA